MSNTESPMQKKKDFTIASFRFLEAAIQIIRSKIMLSAAEIAEQESLSKEEVYVVKAEHINTALEQMGLKHLLS